MADRDQILNAARRLAELALEMLDSVGESWPAMHLQHAVDIMAGASPPTADAPGPPPRPDAIAADA